MNITSLVSYTVGLQLLVNLKLHHCAAVDALLSSSDERSILMQIFYSRERERGSVLSCCWVKAWSDLFLVELCS